MNISKIFFLIIFMSLPWFSMGFAQNYMKNYLPEDAIARFGKGYVFDFDYSPNGTQIAVGSTIGSFGRGGAGARFAAETRIPAGRRATPWRRRLRLCPYRLPAIAQPVDIKRFMRSRRGPGAAPGGVLRARGPEPSGQHDRARAARF